MEREECGELVNPNEVVGLKIEDFKNNCYPTISLSELAKGINPKDIDINSEYNQLVFIVED